MKYLAVTRIAARQVLSARGEALARIAFYVAVLLIFSRLWRVMAAQGQIAGFGAVAMVWYLAITEWITLATPVLYLKIQEEVRRGDIAYRIARPASYLWIHFAEGVGEGVVRLAWLGGAGLLLAWGLTGAVPDPAGLLAAVPLGLLATLLLLLFQLAIGLSTFWTQDAAPVYWIWQKFCFVFGGLLFPLEIYPDWLRTIAMWTPFQHIMHGCGRMAFGFDAVIALETAGKLVFWSLVMLVFVRWMYARALRVMDVNGG